MSSEKNTDVHPVAVVKSSQPLLAEEFIEKLKKELSAASPKLLFESKNLDDVSLSEIVEDARTLPMFHERKLIVAKGYDGLGKRRSRSPEQIRRGPGFFLGAGPALRGVPEGQGENRKGHKTR